MLTSTPPTGAAPLRRIWVVAFVLICGLTLWSAFRHIDGTLPYPQHVDEAFLTGPAHRTVVTGNLHPYTFNYPSLPKYLAAAGMAVGFIQSATRLELREVQDIGNVGYPYYDSKRPMQTARRLYALLGVVALSMSGISAWLAFGRPAVLVTAPLVLLLSPLYWFHTWTYLNVDLVAASFASLALAATLAATRRTSLFQAAVLPGACAGLATGSKYTLAITIVPVLLGIVLCQPRGQRLRGCAAALVAMVVAFLVAVPYSLLDIPGFLNGVASEAFHYASGHRGYNEEPGLLQFLYYARHVASEFGIAGVVVAMVGLAALARADWRRALVLVSLPTVLLVMLSAQRVHFPRNVLSLHPIVAIWIAIGLSIMHEWLGRLLAQRAWSRRVPGWLLKPGLALLLFVGLLPVGHLVAVARVRVDSRNLATSFLLDRVPADWAIAVPAQLGFDTRPLEAAGRRVVKVDLQSARDAGSLSAVLGTVPTPAVVLVPRWGADDRFPNSALATVLNQVQPRWRPLRAFGSNDVLVNYSYSTPWGDPSFTVSVLE
ncbi:MAG: hypothetical protein ABL982_08930 [Vicinamibacterales bacterium]